MVITRFDGILKEFESFFNCKLKSDENNSCLIQLGTGISIQMELNRTGQLIISCRIGTLPMSRYRETLLRVALLSNEATLPSSGTFGFSTKTNNLTLFLLVNPEILSKEYISSILPPFLSKAKLWSEAVASGRTPVVEQVRSEPLPTSLMGFFGSSSS